MHHKNHKKKTHKKKQQDLQELIAFEEADFAAATVGKCVRRPAKSVERRRFEEFHQERLCVVRAMNVERRLLLREEGGARAEVWGAMLTSTSPALQPPPLPPPPHTTDTDHPCAALFPEERMARREVLLLAHNTATSLRAASDESLRECARLRQEHNTVVGGSAGVLRLRGLKGVAVANTVLTLSEAFADPEHSAAVWVVVGCSQARADVLTEEAEERAILKHQMRR